MKTNLRLLVKLVFIISFVSACGYHFASSAPELGPGYKSISIPIFENDTSESNLESIFTRYFREEFIQNSNLSLLSSSRADLVLQGKVTHISTSIVSYRKPEESIESRVTVTISVQCKQTSDGKIIWQRSLSHYQEYFQDPDPLVTLQNRQKAIDFVARYLAEEVHQKLAARF